MMFRRALVASLVVTLPGTADAGSARPSIMPLFVVSSQDSTQAYLLACAKPAKKGKGTFMSGAACAKALANKKVLLDHVNASDKHTPIDVTFKPKNGWPCSAPVKAKKQPYLELSKDMSGGMFLVPATFSVLPIAKADDKIKVAINVAVAHATAKQATRAQSAGVGDYGATAVGLFDLDLDGTNEIIVRDTELFSIYDSAGKPLAGSVGCYTGG